MQVEQTDQGFALYKEKERIGWVPARAQPGGGAFGPVWLDPAWRGRGYGSYLLKEALRRWGGFETGRATVFTAPLPGSEAEEALWAKFGFVPEGGQLVRRRTPDLSAVQLAQQFVAGHCPAPSLCIDATCGNGGDTAFLWQLVQPGGGRLLAMDIQDQAIRSTRRRLERMGADPDRCRLVQDSHEHLLDYVRPGSADAVMFNFGWLPGADHQIHSEAGSSLRALEAALEALRPGGILSAVLYSGRVVGWEERDRVLDFFRSLPLQLYTVLVCDFANWDKTAPLPCFVLKK